MHKKDKDLSNHEAQEKKASVQNAPFADYMQPTGSPAAQEGEADGGGSALPSQVDYGDLISSALQKQKKKRSPKLIVFLCIVFLLVVVFVIQTVLGFLQGPLPTYAETQMVETGSINQTLSSSGPVQSGDKRVIYAPASAPIAELNLTAGAFVSAGDELVVFDTTELSRSVETAGASLQQASLQQQQSQQASAEASQNASDYQNGITNTRQQREIANINLAEAQANLASVTANVSPTLAAKKSQLDSMRTQQTSLLTTDSAAATALQPQIDALATEVSALEGQLSAATSAVSAAQADVEQHNSIISQLESAASQAEAGVLDATAQAQLQTQLVAPQNSLESVQEQLSAAQEGVSAPIGGVVTDVQVAEGAMAQQYAPICTIQSTDNVEVLLSLSQYDLEQVRVGQSATVTVLGHSYNGTVNNIDLIATEQASQTGTSTFVGATVSIENPDENITLGLDATVIIHTGEAQNVLVVPTTAINTDVTGTYAMVEENGMATRRTVETGLSSDTMIEVVSGLSAGENVILSSQDIVEGTTISDDVAYSTAPTMSPMMMG